VFLYFFLEILRYSRKNALRAQTGSHSINEPGSSPPDAPSVEAMP
jgi:hypothetical protein